MIEVAKAMFSEGGADTSLEAIVKGAGVGIGTLYRHFPTRDALIESVYRNETQNLALAAHRFAETLPPVEALCAWLRLFVDHIATKQVLSPALASMVGGSSELYAESGAMVKTAIALLVDRAVASGTIRLDIDPLDLLRAWLASPASVLPPVGRRVPGGSSTSSSLECKFRLVNDSIAEAALTTSDQTDARQHVASAWWRIHPSPSAQEPSPSRPRVVLPSTVSNQSKACWLNRARAPASQCAPAPSLAAKTMKDFLQVSVS